MGVVFFIAITKGKLKKNSWNTSINRGSTVELRF